MESKNGKTNKREKEKNNEDKKMTNETSRTVMTKKKQCRKMRLRKRQPDLLSSGEEPEL